MHTSSYIYHNMFLDLCEDVGELIGCSLGEVCCNILQLLLAREERLSGEFLLLVRCQKMLTQHTIWISKAEEWKCRLVLKAFIFS